MEKEFIPYEIALKLKELGFDEECLAWYYLPANTSSENDYILALDSETPENQIVYIKAPLWQQCIDWFRKIPEISIEILYEGGLHSDTFEYSYQIFSNYYSPKSEKMNYYKCREQAILKAIELCKMKKN